MNFIIERYSFTDYILYFVSFKDICEIPMRTSSGTGNRERCLGPVVLAIYKFGSIQFSDTVILE